MRLLIVEDEEMIADYIRLGLKKQVMNAIAYMMAERRRTSWRKKDMT